MAAKKRGEPVDHVLLYGPPGLGKGHPVDTPMLTPEGWKQLGDLKAGDQVIGSDGKPTEVLEVYERGELPVFEVTFSDGSSVKCDDEHLWQFRTRKTQNKEWKPWNVVSVHDLRTGAKFGWRDRVNRDAWGYLIPIVAPIEHSENQLPIPPYLLGVLIANGNLNKHEHTPWFSTNNRAIAERAASEAEAAGFHVEGGEELGYTALRWGLYGKEKGSRHRPNLATAALRDLGLWHKGSREKFIPSQYLIASISDRRALLQGLMDCDGYQHPTGSKTGPLSHGQMQKAVGM